MLPFYNECVMVRYLLGEVADISNNIPSSYCYNSLLPEHCLLSICTVEVFHNNILVRMHWEEIKIVCDFLKWSITRKRRVSFTQFCTMISQRISPYCNKLMNGEMYHCIQCSFLVTVKCALICKNFWIEKVMTNTVNI